MPIYQGCVAILQNTRGHTCPFSRTFWKLSRAAGQICGGTPNLLGNFSRQEKSASICQGCLAIFQRKGLTCHFPGQGHFSGQDISNANCQTLLGQVPRQGRVAKAVYQRCLAIFQGIVLQNTAEQGMSGQNLNPDTQKVRGSSITITNPEITHVKSTDMQS